MNRNLINLIILWILSLVGISFYGGVLSYGIFFVLTMIPLISLLYILIVYFRFRIYQRLDAANLVCGHESEFYFTLQNEGPVGFFGVKVRFYSSFSTINGIDDGVEYELAPNTGIQKMTGLLCRYRGEYEVGIERVVISDHFRLFTISYRNREPLRVNVKPDLVTLNELKSADITLSAPREQMTNPIQPDILVREYVNGDDMRRINWKATASTGKLMVREYIGEERHGVGIILDPRRVNGNMHEYIPTESKVLETVLALAMFFCGRKTPVSVYSMSSALSEDDVAMGQKFEEFYEKMSGFMFRENADTDLMHSMMLQSGTVFCKKTVFMVSHTWDDANKGFAGALWESGIPVIAYIVGGVPNESDDGGASHWMVVRIGTDDDLTEVL